MNAFVLIVIYITTGLVSINVGETPTYIELCNYIATLMVIYYVSNKKGG